MVSNNITINNYSLIFLFIEYLLRKFYLDKTNGLIPMDIIDEPLLIVLDEDDYDDDNFNVITTNSNSNLEEQTILAKNLLEKGIMIFFVKKQIKFLFLFKYSDESDQIRVKKIMASFSIESNDKPEVVHSSPKSYQQSENLSKSSIQTNTIIDKQRRTKSVSKRKNPSTTSNPSIDSALSYISFDKVSNILTISRMGSIYYCLEDIYLKIFSSLCTLDEFTDLIIKPKIILIKQVTLSEKLAIIEENSNLKIYSHIRYRLISIDSSDYLIKLKQLLLNNKKSKNIEKIINEISNYKQISTSIVSNDKSN